MPNSTIISVGREYRYFDDSVEVHDELPVSTYKVKFDPMSGPRLVQVDEIEVGSEKVYGNHKSRARRAINTYKEIDRGLGILMSGDKGMGKSLMVRMLADQVRDELQIPVILVDQDFNGLAEFLDGIGEAMVVFDEFEKNFSIDSEDGNRQNQFLSLFDGLSSRKRMYVLTVNRLHNLSEYFVNRPGRFHYHLRFDYPDANSVRTYLKDQAPHADDAQIDLAVIFSQKVNVNYDHLRAIAFELNHGEKFNDIIGDLNIKRLERSKYKMDVKFSNGKVESAQLYLDLFEDAEQVISIGHDNLLFQLRLDVSKVILGDDHLVVPPEAVQAESLHDDDDEEEYPGGVPEPEAYSLRLIGQNSYSYAV